jgi:hypothetical protein
MWTVVVVTGTAIVLACAIYRFIKRPFWAAGLAAAITAEGLQVVVRLELGYFDMFWPIAVVTSFASTFAAALIVLLGWRYFASRRRG